MKTVFSYLVLSGILIGAVVSTVGAQSGPASQGDHKKEKAQVVIVEKRDHGKNGAGSGQTKPPK